MTKMEFDLTDEQIAKVNQLEKNGISVGKAIDLLFEIKEEAMKQMDEVDENIDVITKITTTSGADKKIDLMEKEYGNSQMTHEMKLRETKRKVSWGRNFFKF